LSENDIVRHALRAAMNAIEANDYKIELPLEALAKKSINEVAPILAFLIISSSRLLDGGDHCLACVHKWCSCCGGPTNFHIGYFRQLRQRVVIHLMGQKRAILLTV
jgi:hypothetical protein